ncbi:MAG: hypothetical protein IH963_12965 [Chloroflexi bacterium]|nr:hypothetical protein [Chloroflexota bacterium]
MIPVKAVSYSDLGDVAQITMEYSHKLSEVIEALGQSYRSIDFRAIIFASGETQEWRSLTTIIRLSSKSVEEVHGEHQRLIRTASISDDFLLKSLEADVDSQGFRGINVELSSHDINDFYQILSGTDHGIVEVGNRRIRVFDEDYGQPISQDVMNWRNDSYANDYGEWPTFFLGIGEQTTKIVGSDGRGGLQPSLGESDLNIWASLEGFSTIKDVFEQVLKVPYGQGKKFEVRAPIYAQILEIRSLDNSVQVRGRFHRALGNLTLECSISQNVGLHHDSTPKDLVGRKELGDAGFEDASGEIEYFSVGFETQGSESRTATAGILKRLPARFDLLEHREKLRNSSVGFQVFTSFVKENEIREYLNCLVSGHGVIETQLYARFIPTDTSKKRDELFEHVVVYILGLCQLNPIHLANPKYDFLTGDQGAGSADILALPLNDAPLLVSCTMAMPDARKINMLTAAETAIVERFALPADQIKLLVVTGKPSVSLTDGAPAVLAAEDLRDLWEMIVDGNVRGAQDRLGVYQRSSW